MKTEGIHHISSMVGHAQKNIDFYAGVLGYRLVKKTLNYDDKSMYHLYYGNETANSGLVTTFPMLDSEEGKVGGDQVGVACYGIRPESLDFWKERLQTFNIESLEYTRFGKKRLSFKDLDGLEIELISTDQGPENTWEFNGIDSNNALIGIERALIYSNQPEKTLELLTKTLGYTKVDEDEDNYLLEVNDGFGGKLELGRKAQERGKMGVGTVHHIAFAVKNEDIDAWKTKLEDDGYQPTEVKNRKYFKSLYFREAGGILIELATQGPGMSVDEDLVNLGQEFIIPEHFKKDNHDNLMPLFVREVQELKGYGYRDAYEYELLAKKHKIIEKIKDLKAKEKLSEADENELKQLKKDYLNKGE